MLNRVEYKVTFYWATGEHLTLSVLAWSLESASILALNQFPVDLHARLTVHVITV